MKRNFDTTVHRTVMKKIISFAENQIKEQFPDMSYSDRVVMAHEEPFWSAANELRDLTDTELQNWKNEYI